MTSGFLCVATIRVAAQLLSGSFVTSYTTPVSVTRCLNELTFRNVRELESRESPQTDPNHNSLELGHYTAVRYTVKHVTQYLIEASSVKLSSVSPVAGQMENKASPAVKNLGMRRRET